jgi:hypothetical protein
MKKNIRKNNCQGTIERLPNMCKDQGSEKKSREEKRKREVSAMSRYCLLSKSF